MAPDDIMVRMNSEGLEPTLSNIEPKTIVKITGVKSIILASGARVSDRNVAMVIAEVCSDIHGSRFSRKAAETFTFVPSSSLSGDFDARGFIALNSPV